MDLPVWAQIVMAAISSGLFSTIATSYVSMWKRNKDSSDQKDKSELEKEERLFNILLKRIEDLERKQEEKDKLHEAGERRAKREYDELMEKYLDLLQKQNGKEPEPV